MKNYSYSILFSLSFVGSKQLLQVIKVLRRDFDFHILSIPFFNDTSVFLAFFIIVNPH